MVSEAGDDRGHSHHLGSHSLHSSELYRGIDIRTVPEHAGSPPFVMRLIEVDEHLMTPISAATPARAINPIAVGDMPSSSKRASMARRI